MTEKAHDKELDALKADIARLVAGKKGSVGKHVEQSHAGAQQEGSSHNEDHGVWSDLLHKFDASRVQGEKVVRDLAAEVEQHPLVSIMAAFGLGYIIAKLWYQENKREDTDDAS
jgi:hypothetical protein